MNQGVAAREAIRQYEGLPYDAYKKKDPWKDISQAKAQSLMCGKVLEIVEYRDPFALLVFGDGTAIQFYGMSAQSTDALILMHWSPGDA